MITGPKTTRQPKTRPIEPINLLKMNKDFLFPDAAENILTQDGSNAM
jgi:hypothetical protein